MSLRRRGAVLLFLRLLKLIAVAGTGGSVPTALRWSLDHIVAVVSAALVRGNDAVVQGALQLAASGGAAYLRRLSTRPRWQAGVAREGMEEQRERASSALALIGGGQIAQRVANNNRAALARAADLANDANAALGDAAASESSPALSSAPRGRGRGRGRGGRGGRGKSAHTSPARGGARGRSGRGRGALVADSE